MIVDKPRIDRDRVLCEEHWRRRHEDVHHAIAVLLRSDETFGGPVREGDRVIIPIVRKGRSG